MECVWCNKKIYPNVTWSTFLYPEKLAPLCHSCQGELRWIERADCIDCGRQYKDGAKKESNRCQDCNRRRETSQQFLTKNRSVFQYNEQLQPMITKWKYRGDYCLIEAFRAPVQEGFKTYFSDLNADTIAVPIPLSPQRLQERAFNQAEAIAQLLPLPTCELLKRVHGEKQSKRSRKERLEASNPFQLFKSTNKPVLLIDDIYTTGTTLQQAAEILIQSGCPEVSSYTLAR